MKKHKIILLASALILICGCGTKEGQVMDGDGMFQIDSTEIASTEISDTTVFDSEIPLNETQTATSASIGGPYGHISVSLPAGWIAEEAPTDSNKLMYGLYGLIIKPETASEGQIELSCVERIGICGTGLESTAIELAGIAAYIGTYDGHERWDFITIGNDNPQIMVQHTDCSSWTDEMWDEVLTVLDTMKFDRNITEGGIGQFIQESQNEEIAVIMEVTDVSSTGLTVHFRQYEKRDTGELLYGEGYRLQVLDGSSWKDVPTIIENGVFTDVGYTIPAQGSATIKTDWEWLHGKLSPGTYRITKLVSNTDPDNPGVGSSTYSLTAQFIITD